MDFDGADLSGDFLSSSPPVEKATAGQDQAWKEVPHADINRIENCRQVIAMMNSSIAGERNASGQGLPTDHTDELPAMMNKRFHINRREWS